jgi:hypothetical protein
MDGAVPVKKDALCSTISIQISQDGCGDERVQFDHTL